MVRVMPLGTSDIHRHRDYDQSSAVGYTPLSHADLKIEFRGEKGMARVMLLGTSSTHRHGDCELSTVVGVNTESYRSFRRNG